MAEPEDRNGAELLVPAELEAGVYANARSVWHTEHAFTLDFAVSRDSPERVPELPDAMLLVARVRIPVTIMFDALLALSRRLTGYEQTFGEIARRRRRDE